MGKIIFTKLSATRVKMMDEEGNVHGFSPAITNVIAHPFEEAIVLTSMHNPIASLNGIKEGMVVRVEDVKTPIVTSKAELVNELLTNYFV